jgi:hypothetical protein
MEFTMRNAEILPGFIRQVYEATRQLPDGRWIGVHRLLYHFTLHVDICPVTGNYEDRYCYETLSGCHDAMLTWTGKDDPIGWHRHVGSGRRRDVKTGREWIAA